jgi:hypothetical protein
MRSEFSISARALDGEVKHERRNQPQQALDEEEPEARDAAPSSGFLQNSVRYSRGGPARLMHRFIVVYFDEIRGYTACLEF